MTGYREAAAVTQATAARAVAVALDEGAKRNLALVAAVVDPATGLVAFGRADGAPPHSELTSRRKAITAASMRQVSSALAPGIAQALASATDGMLTGIPGGVPIAFAGVHAGGLGVAGGPPDVDEAVALAVLAALGADPQAR